MRRLLLLLICGLSLAGTGQAATAPLPVFVSILPQKYFVEQIGGTRVDVRVMVQPGASPATYEPSPRQMAALTRSVLYFAIGVPFEQVWLEKIAAANPRMTLVRTDRGIDKRAMATHDHEAGEHARQGLDPHIWLAPRLVRIQARTILEALKEADPAGQEIFTANYRAFISAVEQLDRELHDLLQNGQNRRFMVFHPSWGYFAEAYGLEQIPVETEGKNPKPAQLRALIEEARRQDIRVIFVQPQFSTRSAELIAREIDGEVVHADPLAADWSGNLRKVAALIAHTLN